MLASNKSHQVIFTKAAVVTPSDSVANVYKSLYIGGTSGAVTVVTSEGDTACFSNVPAGTILPIATSLVKSSGTGATTIIGLN